MRLHPGAARRLALDLHEHLVELPLRDGRAEALEEILGADFAPHFQILGCRKGRLVVELNSAPLFAELSGFRREEIRKRINELVPDRPVAVLTFRLGGTGHR